MLLLDTNICIYLINQRDQELRERFEANAGPRGALQLDLDILPFDQDASRHYGAIRHALAQRVQPIGANDLLIAAHARSVAATLVTNNAGEFGRVPGLQVENWTAR